MRALSVRQPWAWLVVNGHLQVVNGEPTPYRGPVLIRAGLSLTQRLHEQVAEFAVTRWGVNIPSMRDLPRGGVVGAAVLSDVVDACADHWSAPDEAAGLKLTRAIALPLFACTPAWSAQARFQDVPLHTLPERAQWLVRELAEV